VNGERPKEFVRTGGGQQPPRRWQRRILHRIMHTKISRMREECANGCFAGAGNRTRGKAIKATRERTMQKQGWANTM
jgi:hypothetical protein